VSGDPLKLVKFVCVAKTHSNGTSDSSLTIHEGAWAFCSHGADARGHEWRPSDGLPLMDAMRFPPRQPILEPVTPAQPAGPGPAAPRGRARSR
jgi:hypothetical protein